MYRYCIFIILLASMLACGDSHESITPQRERITESVYASGLVQSKNQYQVFATVNGLIRQRYVQEGDTVRKGMPLFSILNETSKLTRENAQLAADLADYSANLSRLEELRLNIDLAKNKMLNDSILLVRQQGLWAENIGSRIDLERAELNFQNSRTLWASAQIRYDDEKRRLDILSRQALKNVEISKTTEGDFTLRSLIDGLVYSIQKEPGEMVNTQTPIAVIGDASSFVIELEVDEYDITSIRTGQHVKITMDSYADQVFDARITRVHPILNPRTKTAKVEAAFETPPSQLYPNLSLEANIILQVKDNALTIPRMYLVGNNQVISVNGDTLTVEVGLKDYQKAEILSGISETDRIILPAL